MKNYSIAKSRRVRSSPYTSRIEKQGVTAYTVYNHMLLPAAFGSIEESCNHLKKDVQVWDVAAERQVEIIGEDAAKLVQLMTCRDLSKSRIGRCYYCPIIDDNGNLVNDPVILKLAEDRWWISIADSDVIFFAKGLASLITRPCIKPKPLCSLMIFGNFFDNSSNPALNCSPLR